MLQSYAWQRATLFETVDYLRFHLSCMSIVDHIVTWQWEHVEQCADVKGESSFNCWDGKVNSLQLVLVLNANSLHQTQEIWELCLASITAKLWHAHHMLPEKMSLTNMEMFFTILSLFEDNLKYGHNYSNQLDEFLIKCDHRHGGWYGKRMIMPVKTHRTLDTINSLSTQYLCLQSFYQMHLNNDERLCLNMHIPLRLKTINLVIFPNSTWVIA